MKRAYSPAVSSSSSSPGADGRIESSHPSPYGSSVTFRGALPAAGFTSTTIPERGDRSSNTVVEDSTSPIGSPAETSARSGGSSTETTSPRNAPGTGVSPGRTSPRSPPLAPAGGPGGAQGRRRPRGTLPARVSARSARPPARPASPRRGTGSILGPGAGASPRLTGRPRGGTPLRTCSGGAWRSSSVRRPPEPG